MTPLKPRRLPKALKKKLEASLKHLSPREAGRLFLIYLHESAKANEDGGPAADYPPINELDEAWAARIKEAQKKGPEEANRVNTLANGYHYLSALALMSNDWAERESYRIGYLASTASLMIDKQLQGVEFNRIATKVANSVAYQLPRPVAREDYDRLIQWATEDAFRDVGYMADEAAGNWAKAQGGFLLTAEEVALTLRLKREEQVKALVEDDRPEEEKGKDIRRLYAEVEGDALLIDRFKGDRAALEDWIQAAGWAGGGITQAAVSERAEALKARVVDLIKAGELQGGEAVALGDCYDSTLIDAEGKIPAWAALRPLWRLWLIDHDYLIRPNDITPDTLQGKLVAYTVDGDLTGEDLVNVVAEFLAECRAKAWGAGITSDVDLVKLARFLSEVMNPLTAAAGEALQLGGVDLAAFREEEGEDPFDVSYNFWVTTAGSLRQRAADLGLTLEDVDEVARIRRRYYLSDTPEEIREDLGRLVNMASVAEPIDRRFLEENIKRLGEVFGEIATVRLVFDLIADEYFDGLPVLLPYVEDRFSAYDQLLAFTEDDLTDKLARLSSDPWYIDTSDLQLVKEPADEDKAIDRVDVIIKYTLQMAGLKSRGIAIDLGDGEDPRARLAKPAPNDAKKPTRAAVMVDAEGEAEE